MFSCLLLKTHLVSSVCFGRTFPGGHTLDFCISVIFIFFFSVGLGSVLVFVFQHLKIQKVFGLSIITANYWL